MDSPPGARFRTLIAAPAMQVPSSAAHTSQIIGSKSSASSTTGETSWINEVRRNINSARPVDQPGNPCTIFQVPQHIRSLDYSAYIPVVASIGPFNHYLPRSSVMLGHKWRCARHLLSLHGSQEHASLLLDKCLLELKKHDDKVRSCYSMELHQWDAQNLALIMFLDGCFIIYLMLKVCSGKESMEKERKKEKGMEEKTKEEKEDNVGKSEDEITEEDEGKNGRECTIETREGEVVLNIKEKEKRPEDPTVAGLFTLDLVVHDLLKLENQIPFFIIELLFDQLKLCVVEKIDLVDLALQLFKGIHPKESESFKKKKKKSPGEYHHLLHLFYLSRIPSEKPVESPSTRGCIRSAIECIKSKEKKAEAAGSTNGTPTSAPKWIPRATELHRAGVKFKRKKLLTDCFLNITFKRRKMKITPLLCLLKLCLIFRSGRMEIPPLQIYDYTCPLFQNLIAFEQCYYGTEMYITIYALFMDCIVDQPEDVRLLQLEGILEHKLSSNQEVAELFNKLGCQIHFVQEKNYLAKQIEKINRFYDSKWHKWLAGLRRDYLGNPWAIISVLAAIFLLLLTVEQAILSALSYFHSS